MGNMEDQMRSETSVEVIGRQELTHIGSVKLIRSHRGVCLLKVFNFSDAYLMEEVYRRLQNRIKRQKDSDYILNVYRL